MTSLLHSSTLAVLCCSGALLLQVQEVSCAPDASVTSCAAEAAESTKSASLLQRTFRRGEGAATLQQPALADGTTSCSGVVSQSRCWHLSALGESCAQTCNKFNEKFAFVLAAKLAPITPELVGHEPVLKQDPWAALECYAPDEDRFHPANENAAKHIEDISSFRNPNCKLACPCVLKVGTLPPATTVDQSPVRDDNAQALTPQNVLPTAELRPAESSADQSQNCMWKPNIDCAREFEYEGKRYSGCAAVDADHDQPWCSTSEKYMGSWSRCSYSCPGRADVTIARNTEQPADQICAWQPAPQCVQSFVYKGREVTGCTDLDHPTPWCSYSSSQTDAWSVCKRVCVPVPRQEEVVSASEPDACMSSATDDDLAGRRATLDNTGYDSLTGVTNGSSLADGKRYVCRIAEKLQCKVVDASSLAAFVPYHVTLKNHENYDGLEQELSQICRKADTWLVPTGVRLSAPSSPPAPEMAREVRVAPASDVCAREPGTKSDILGNSASLDETGYAGLVALSGDSPSNMRRFMCRVVEKIKCRVVDASSLSAFVPYYSSLKTQETYAHLEQELSDICRAGNKWVVPQ